MRSALILLLNRTPTHALTRAILAAMHRLALCPTRVQEVGKSGVATSLIHIAWLRFEWLALCPWCSFSTPCLCTLQVAEECRQAGSPEVEIFLVS